MAYFNRAKRAGSTTAQLSRMLLLSAAALPLAGLAIAQDDVTETTTDTEEVRELDTVTVTGSRQVIQDAIGIKRSNTQIVDGISAAEIGDLPALSIGEALESITGAASHRENGGATEVSIRGLGPYLSSTVVNGRAATNGSGDRSVNFSQFPSELVNKLAIFKTQDASQIEGGVAGQIQIETLKPLDFGERRINGEFKLNVNPDQLNQDDTEAGDFGYRGTLSFVDQFDLDELGKFGVSVGFQRSDISQPEAESRSTGPTSNSRAGCLITDGLAQYTDQTNGGTFTGFSNNPETTDRGDDDCDDFNDRRNPANLATRGSDTEGFDTEIDPATGLAIDAGTPFVFAPSQRHYRQNDTRDERDALFGAFQWQPNDKLDINLDLQYSERIQSEQRNDLTFNGGRRNDTSLNVLGESVTTLDTLQYTDSGAILYQITDSTIEVQGGDYQRVEEYLGGGLNFSYDVSDRLNISADFAHSNTERTEQAKEFRIQSNISPVIVFDRTNSDVPLYTLYDEVFDVNDHSNFVDRLRVRIDNDILRENTIESARFDVDYELDTDFFTTFEAGVRVARQDYLELPGGSDSGNPYSITGGRFSFEIEDNTDLNINNRQVVDGSGDALSGDADLWVDIIAATNQACRTEFPEDDFLGSVASGDLVTNIADDGTVISSTNSWATFDAACVADTAVNSLNSILDDINLAIADRGDVDDPLGLLSSSIPSLIRESSRTIDVEETTTAFYAMTGYETQFNNLPVSGNIGVRVVQTEVESTGYRPQLTVTETDGVFTIAEGSSTPVSLSHDYTEILPSANAIIELSDNKVLRFGIFKALSRPDPADMGYGRSINVIGEDEDATSADALITSISANGNPAFDPLTSWNYDAGFEWYPNDDSIFAVSAYYKKFQGGFENVVANETFNLNGADIEFPVSVQQVSKEESELYGFEFTGAHSFNYLPGYWSGLGAKISYNYADSNFEFEDSRYGNISQRQLDGSVVQTNQGIIAPASLPGLSKHTLSTQVYYQIGDFDLQVNYKYRDSYFQPFVSDGTRLRYVGDVGVWEARASYELNDHIRFQVDAINLFSEPKEQFAYVEDDLYEVNDYGPRVFFGVRARF